MSNHDQPVTTEILLDGANCSLCFNETVRSLQAQPGVVAVNGSIGAQCFRVDHDGGVADDRLLAIVTEHLHADDVSSSEHNMVAVDAKIAQLGCGHGDGHGHDHGTHGSDCGG